MLDSGNGETVRLPFQVALCCCHPSDDDLYAFVGRGKITALHLISLGIELNLDQFTGLFGRRCPFPFFNGIMSRLR
jgi:hypothetical protein